MDILSLKRQLWAMPGARNEDGDGGAGGSMGASDQSSGPGGTAQSGGYSGGNGYDGGYNSMSYGGNLGSVNTADYTPSPSFAAEHPSLSNLISMGSGLLGGLFGGLVGSIGLKGAVGYAMNQPGLSPAQKADLASAAAEAESTYGADMDRIASSGFNPQGDADNQSATASGLTTPGATTPATTAGTSSSDALNELISTHFSDGTSADPLNWTAPTYNADPTGLVAQASGLAGQYAQQGQANYDEMRGLNKLYGSDDYRAQQRGRAMADVQQQADSAYQTAQRDQMRMGVNPASGRMAAMGNQRAMQTALGKVSAAANSDTTLRDTYAKGLASLQTANSDMAKSAQGWSAIGNDASKNNLAWGLGSSELGLQAATQNQNNTYNWGSLANQKYGIDRGVFNNAATIAGASDRQDSANLASLAGLGLNSATKVDWSKFWDSGASSGLANYTASDPMLEVNLFGAAA